VLDKELGQPPLSAKAARKFVVCTMHVACVYHSLQGCSFDAVNLRSFSSIVLFYFSLYFCKMFNSNLMFAIWCGLLASSGYVSSLRTPLKRVSSTGVSHSSALNFVSLAVLNINKRTGGVHDTATKLYASKAEPVAGLGDDGCALPSPSGVNTLPLPAQAAVFFGYYLALYGGTTAVVAGQCLLGNWGEVLA
jgi:hypothetical protein